MSTPPQNLDFPEQIAEAFAGAWNATDANRLAALFTDDADFVNVVGLWWNDRASIRTAHDYGFRRIFADSHMQVENTRLRMLTATAAVVHTRWMLTGQSAPQSRDRHAATGTRRGVISFVMQAQADGGWLAVAAHNTDRMPGSETNLAAQDAAGSVSVRPASYQSPAAGGSRSDSGSVGRNT